MPPKRDVARALLLRGSVYVHLDPTVTEVEVPTWCKDQQQLVLHVGLDMPIPIPDLRVDASGVSGTLSFRRVPFRCVVPWHAIFALTGDDGRGLVWPESVPVSLRDVVGSPAPLSSSISLPEPDREPGLRVVGSETSEKKAPSASTLPVSPVSSAPALASVPEPSEVRPELSPAELDLAHDLEVQPDSLDAPKGPREKRKLPPYLRVVK